jgi:copper chaperone NosL
MNWKSRILMVVGALMLIGLYYQPFWTINMSAPQYPEGIGMYIHIDDVTGHKRHDLQSINTLNHYIGMAEIHKEDFWEFEIMPWIIGFMIVFGVLAGITGSMKLVFTWLVLMVLLGIAGLVDFYLWGHEYGNNLSPDAPIKVPGMSYQPPLLGCKQLLNINACSWPYIGSIYIGLSMVFAAGAVWIGKKENKDS